MTIPHEPVPSATSPTPAAGRPISPAPRPHSGSAWASLGAGAVVLAVLVVFMLQNTASVPVTFLGLHGTAPLALMLLIAGGAVAVLALTVGYFRRDPLRHHHRTQVP